jgi:hypothetical protein
MWQFWIAAPVWRGSDVVVSFPGHQSGQKDNNFQSDGNDVNNLAG